MESIPSRPRPHQNSESPYPDIPVTAKRNGFSFSLYHTVLAASPKSLHSYGRDTLRRAPRNCLCRLGLRCCGAPACLRGLRIFPPSPQTVYKACTPCSTIVMHDPIESVQDKGLLQAGVCFTQAYPPRSTEKSGGTAALNETVNRRQFRIRPSCRCRCPRYLTGHTRCD